MQRIPELDGLRGVAIALVLVFHFFGVGLHTTPGTFWAYVQALGRLSWTGVDLFFVLSGFLIGGILLDARNSPNYFRTFYVRRFLRIVPIYAALLAGVLALIYIPPAARLIGLTPNEPIPWPYFVFLQNFWMAQHNSLGILGLGATWSLAIEEQFYLTLPLIIRKVDLQLRIPLLLLAIAAAPLLRTAIYFIFPAHRWAVFVLMPCRADALLLGVLGAILIRDPKWRQRLSENYAAMLTALAIFVAGAGVLTQYGHGAQLNAPMVCFGYTWMALLYLCALLLAVTHSQSRLSSALRWRWLGWLGAIAYGTYLLHEFVRRALLGLAVPELLSGLAAIPLVLLLCYASWTYFEKPLVQLGHRWRY